MCKRCFRPAPLAVSFAADLTYDFNIEPDIANSRRFTNKHGVSQGTCAHLGECDLGCRADAKNTLDKNYLHIAEKSGAELWPLHLVTRIDPATGGYRVSFNELQDGVKISGAITATRVIVAAGSMGSTELLLQCRDLHGSLTRLSSSLGKRWSSNGDFLTPALYLHRALWADRGTTIGAVIDYLDGSDAGQTYWIQDGGTPNLLNKYFEALIHHVRKNPADGHLVEGLNMQSLLQHLTLMAANFDLSKHIMPWFAQGVDAGDGVLHLTDGLLDLDWNLDASLPVFETIGKRHETLAKATDGHPFPLPTWLLSKSLITPHPLGGCNMGSTADTGVVNHGGEVFGHPNLFVADGAIVPRPLGVNPSRTIAALAEHIVECMPL